MQYSNKDYNPEKHDRWRALTVKQPYANDLVTEAYKDENGIVYGKKTIEVRSKNTSYRGDVLICSAASPVYPGMESGVTLGLVELYDVKPIKEFTPEDWENTRIPKEKRAKITKGYGWLMRNPRRVIEMPIKGQLGIYNLVYTKDCILPYPVAMVMDKKGYELARKEATMGKSNCPGQSKPEKICGTCQYFNPEFPVNGKPAPVCLALKMIKGGTEYTNPRGTQPHFRCSCGKYERRY